MIPYPTPPGDILRVYDPGTLKIMAAAFDKACQFLPSEYRGNPVARRKLALRIIRVIESGERDPVRLADSAIVYFNH